MGLHVGDAGTLLRCLFQTPAGAALDISSATTKEISFEKPSATIVTRAGAFITNGADGLLKYTLVTADLDQAGYWYLQGHVILAGGVEFHSDRVRVRVFPNNG